MKKRFYPSQQDFTCKHCGNWVSVHPILSGVSNRNHCPYCLWSRHVDLFSAGDRLSACKGAMKPIGLTIKRQRKKYGDLLQGELMLIHSCTECGAVSINRLAADDDADRLLSVYEDSLHLEGEICRTLAGIGIFLIEEEHRVLVSQRITGTMIVVKGEVVR
ncbi:protein containing RNHCP domain [Bellilinea caldifistulae]|uniref:RNHCP domain-containing protein n=1 Tax=Bellilinea caldifistulae TaxID=360411 RepID=UPI0007836ACD|nr:RNHCP domain-containing protein [Bellilinea caldifistulae]GAP11655.1 protein containing RNHCP domain [Bellilinea caldifistulae]